MRSPLALCFVVALSLPILTANQDKAEPAANPEAIPVPVDDDMHHLMEYVFEPAYKRLKKSVATEPKDKAGWSAIKEDTLTLAESSNLLLHRLPEEDQKDWIKMAVEVRTEGGKLYQSARAKKFDQVTVEFSRLLKSCNACHDKFADGEHQLSAK